MQQIGDDILMFTIENLRLALPLSRVERVIRAVEVAPVPHASEHIVGIIDLQGAHIPVVQLRHRFGMQGKDIGLTDRFIISSWRERQFALVADEVRGIRRVTSQDVNPVDLRMAPDKAQQLSDVGLEIFEVVSEEDTIVLICDLEKLLGNQAILAIEDFFAHDQENS